MEEAGGRECNVRDFITEGLPYTGQNRSSRLLAEFSMTFITPEPIHDMFFLVRLAKAGPVVANWNRSRQ